MRSVAMKEQRNCMPNSPEASPQRRSSTRLPRSLIPSGLIQIWACEGLFRFDLALLWRFLVRLR
jgi:hypothetical protein